MTTNGREYEYQLKLSSLAKKQYDFEECITETKTPREVDMLFVHDVQWKIECQSSKGDRQKACATDRKKIHGQGTKR